MRRLVAFVLLVAFLLQSSGSAALAASPRRGGPSLLASARGFLGTTLLGAVFTGTLSRYAAMHDTRPDFTAVHRHRAVDVSRIRTSAFVAGRPASGRRLVFPAGFAEMRPPSRAAAQAAQSARAAQARIAAHQQMLPAPARVTPAPTFRSTRAAAAVRTQMVDTTTPATTGINRYWTYTEGAIPGSGKYMVNVASGNVLVEGDDIDIPERGIDLTFRRMYNSQSLHDWHAGDGSTEGNYGGGWTNNLDSHLGYDETHNVISWYDIDGARYDYQCSGTVCTPPAGQYATMTYDGGCGYWITKKSGTAYHFWAPTFNMTITPQCYTQGPEPFGGVLGRVVTIWARNQNNNLQFTYSFDNGDASSASNLSQILVQHSDGQSLTLSFGDVNGQRVLLSILRPDGKYVRYGYDSAIELSDVCTPGNGNTDSSPGAAGVCGDTVHTHHRYGYNGGSNVHQLAWADSPRYTMTWGAAPAMGWVNFSYDGSNRLAGVENDGIVNFTPDDGTGALLQPTAPTGIQAYRDEQYGYSSGVTTVTDSDGHATKYTYDGQGREIQRQAWSGTEYLTSADAWDANDDLIATTDARGNETDYAYDTNGNTIAEAAPSISTSMGTLRPTTLISYDAYNNVVASCDPTSVGASGYDWVNRPQSDTLCSSRSVKTRYVYDTSDSNEPFGRLTDTYTPLGYHHQLLYSTTAQGGDFGLPSDVIGDAMSQEDGTNRQPHQTFTYDARGDLQTYSTGVGTWTLAYDGINRQISTTDADNVTNRTCYLDNGQVDATQTAAQYALDGTLCGTNSVSYVYDDDGNAVSETHHFSGIAGVTRKWYDGDGRLIEVAQPQDTRSITASNPTPVTKPIDGYASPWLTRYMYDQSQGGLLQIGAVGNIAAYGNLYKTQEYVPSNPIVTAGAPGPAAWSDVRGTAFDPLDRATASYELAFGTTPKLTNAYDGTNPLTGADDSGMLKQSQSAVGALTTPTYDDAGSATATTFQNDSGLTPSRTAIYDPNGRAVSMSSSAFANESFTYDADGRLTTHVDPTASGYQPVTTTYDYYGDGQRKALSVSSTMLTATDLFTYSYRADGPLQTEGLGGTMSGHFAWTYTAAGRELTQSDPDTGDVMTNVSPGWTLVPRTQTYDAYGRLQSLELPEGFTYSAITYDPEGETLSYQRSFSSGGSNGLMTQSYSVRGELVGQAVTGGLPKQRWAYSATTYNGLVDCSGPKNDLNNERPCTTKFDARSSMVLQNNTGFIGYDTAGRNVTQSDGASSPSVMTRTYDAENHLASQTYAGPNGQYQCHDGQCPNPPTDGSTAPTTLPNGDGVDYAWGPSGQMLIERNALTAADAGYEHWDGDSLLMEQQSYPGGTAPALIHVGKLAVDGFIEDRDLTGTLVASHDSSEQSGWSDNRAFQIFSKPFGHLTFPGGSPYVDGYAPGILSPVRPDGYSDIWGNVFQGVRVYDPITAQWTAPDAYAGDVHDPMSQKPFMWNGNNPLDFEDPSGYYIFANGTSSQRHAVANSMESALKITRSAQSKLKRNSAAYHRLAALIHDLTPGTSSWQISFAPLGVNNPASTEIDYSEAGTKVVGMSSTGTVIDFSQFGGMGSSSQVGTLVTEGGKYDMASGAAGPALYKAMERAVPQDASNGNGKQVDKLANENYSLLVHTELDCDPESNC